MQSTHIFDSTISHMGTFVYTKEASMKEYREKNKDLELGLEATEDKYTWNSISREPVINDNNSYHSIIWRYHLKKWVGGRPDKEDRLTSIKADEGVGDGAQPQIASKSPWVLSSAQWEVGIQQNWKWKCDRYNVTILKDQKNLKLKIKGGMVGRSK